MRPFFVLCFLCTVLPLLHGDVLCPRVLTAHNADVSDLGRFRQYQPWTDKQGEALAIVFTPWIIVPRVNDLDDPDDDSEAAVVTIDAARPVTVLVSPDQGKSWRAVTTVQAGKASVDLTRWVKGMYDYLLKLHATGQSNELVLQGLKIDTWVQVAPMSLPRLQSGVNHCRYELGDRYGRATLPMFVQPNVADPEDRKRYAVQMPADYDPNRRVNTRWRSTATPRTSSSA